MTVGAFFTQAAVWAPVGPRKAGQGLLVAKGEFQRTKFKTGFAHGFKLSNAHAREPLSSVRMSRPCPRADAIRDSALLDRLALDCKGCSYGLRYSADVRWPINKLFFPDKRSAIFSSASLNSIDVSYRD